MQCDVVVVGAEVCGNTYKGIVAFAGVALAERVRELPAG